MPIDLLPGCNAAFVESETHAYGSACSRSAVAQLVVMIPLLTFLASARAF